MRQVKCLRWLSILLLAFSGVVFSQTSSTSLQGTVTDPAGSAVAGASVVLANEAKLQRTTVTDAQGGYRLLALPPGTYALTITATGFARYQQTGLQLLVNTPATANIQLKVGGASEVVNVSSEAPVLNMVDASLGNSFQEVQVKEIPLEGRNVPDLLSLQAGVSYTGNRSDIADHGTVENQDTRNGAVNGARSDQSNITLDGIDVNDQSAGYAFDSVVPITQDSVQEFRVTTSNYNADQGGGSGAQVALVTKSGTNAFHGALYESNRNTFTSASDYELQKPLQLKRNIFGASVGGPVQKNRAFFFVNYEGTRRREAQSSVRTIPSVAMRDGVVMYQCAVPSSCPGGQVTGVSNKVYNVPAGVFGLSPYNAQGSNNLQALDPLGLGPSPTMLAYFNQTYGNLVPNDPAAGDGLNYVGYLFPGSIKDDNNVFIARLDYHLTADGKHTLSWRGNLQNRFNPQAPFLPGTAPEQTLVDHSKGMALGYTAVLNSHQVNTFRWGFTRQSTGIVGNTNQPWNIFYGLDQGIFYSHSAQTPVHSFTDDFGWNKGTHNLQFGGNVGFARNPRQSNERSFSLGKGATNWMSPTGFANTGGAYLDPGGLGFPEPASSPQYDLPVLSLLGMVSDVVANYNYDKSDNLLAPGTPINRKYGLNWYEFYGQDSWRVKPNLTITYGLRWSLFPPPWEVNGFQASPTCIAAQNPMGCPSWASTLGDEFNQIEKLQQQGLGYGSVPLVSFMLGGKANHAPGFYNFEKTDFAPRISFAYSPRPGKGWLKAIFGDNDKSVIRGGFSRVYDRAGLQLASTFDENAPGGLAATVQNACCLVGFDDAANVPRINSNLDPNSSINVVPACGPVNSYTGSIASGSITCNGGNQQFFQSNPQSGAFPQTPNSLAQAITWGLDQSMKTPHAYAFDFSFSRELPSNFSLQLAYVGRLGRNLLTQRDLRQPTDLVDPKTGIDYYAAATRLSQLARQGTTPSQITDSLVGKTAAFWHDMLPQLQNGATTYQDLSTGFVSPISGNAGLLPVIFDLYYDPALSYAGNEVVGLAYVDYYPTFGLGDNTYFPGDTQGFYTFCSGPCTASSGYGAGGGNALSNQDSSMFGWSSIGTSSYNALQATLSKKVSHNLQFDFNYTYSKSIDITSAATRLGFSSSVNVGAPGSRLVNAWSPNQRRAVSDFDTTHQVNANWVFDLPVGKGQTFARNAGSGLDAVVGGWELSGIARWTSGFPLSVDNGNFWPTNWDEQGIAQMVTRPKTGRFRHADGSVGIFPDASGAWADFQNPFPGQSGSRNVIRGDGYAGLDMALSKRWKMPWEGHSVQFRWEVFNVPNLHRFNVASGLQTQAGCACIASMQQPNTFGDYTGTLTNARVMQFDLRYEF
jgi:Carboxypeptidase regulatory-like domain